MRTQYSENTYTPDPMDDLMDSQPWDWSARNKVFRPTSLSMAKYRRDMLVWNDEAHRHAVLDSEDAFISGVEEFSSDSVDESQRLRRKLVKRLLAGEHNGELTERDRFLLSLDHGNVDLGKFGPDGNPTFEYERQERPAPESGSIEYGLQTFRFREAARFLGPRRVKRLGRRVTRRHGRDLYLAVVVNTRRADNRDLAECRVDERGQRLPDVPPRRRFSVYRDRTVRVLKRQTRHLSPKRRQFFAHQLVTTAASAGLELPLQRVLVNPSTAINVVLREAGAHAVLTGDWDTHNRLRLEIQQALFPLFYGNESEIAAGIGKGKSSLSKVNQIIEQEATVFTSQLNVPRRAVDAKLGRIAAIVRRSKPQTKPTKAEAQQTESERVNAMRPSEFLQFLRANGAADRAHERARSREDRPSRSNRRSRRSRH